MSELNEPRPFDHAKNITVGRGRILYDETGGVKNGQWHPPGWVLPGGARTGDVVEAYKAAEAIDLMSGGQKLPIGVAG
jgi:hypothetical protein